MTEKKYVKCGCVEEVGLRSSPCLCCECGFGDDEDGCKTEKKEYYLYKEVKE